MLHLPRLSVCVAINNKDNNSNNKHTVRVLHFTSLIL